jgi:hypothetical protein
MHAVGTDQQLARHPLFAIVPGIATGGLHRQNERRLNLTQSQLVGAEATA